MRRGVINPNAPSELQKPPSKILRVGKVAIKRKMLSQTPVGMANSTTSTKYIPPRKSTRKQKI